MKRFLATILSISLLFTIIIIAAKTESEIEETKRIITERKNNTPDSEKTNEIFVKAKDDSETEKILKIALSSFEYEIIKVYETTKAYFIAFNSVREADRAIDLLNAREDILYAEPNYIITLDMPVLGEDEIENPEQIGHGDLAAPSTWAGGYVTKAKKIGILNGIKLPFAKKITREEFCILAYNMLDKTGKIKWQKVSPNPFTDTKSEKVMSLYLADIIEGKDEKIFAPDDELTREEAATILKRMAEKFDITHHELYYVFDDENEISDWAMDSVQVICNMGIMKGVGENKFDPKGGYTVEQAITTLVRVFDTVGANEYTYLSFADKMYKNMPEDKNYMFSPISVKMALMMGATGASGETQKEILDTLGVADLDSYNRNIKAMLERYSAYDILRLDIANSIWINEDKTEQRFSEGYKDILSDIFRATADCVDNETAAKEINSWVNDKTNGKIPEIIEKGNEDFWAMILNAVYFKGRWQNEFNKGSTKEDTFYSKDGSKASIDFMNKTANMSYGKVGDITIINLPYLNREAVYSENGDYLETKRLEGMDISMYLLMGNETFNPEEVLENPDLKSKFVSLSVPKFKIEYSTYLNDILKTIGINRAFREDAEFSDMFTSGNMWIDSVIHKTYISVDEEGTEAAAVTGMAMGGTALPPEPIEVKFNKPFTFVIKDNRTGEILFMGEYAYAE